MAKTSSRSAKRKETKPYYKYGKVFRNKDQYTQYVNKKTRRRKRLKSVFLILFFIFITIGLVILLI